MYKVTNATKTTVSLNALNKDRVLFGIGESVLMEESKYIAYKKGIDNYVKLKILSIEVDTPVKVKTIPENMAEDNLPKGIDNSLIQEDINGKMEEVAKEGKAKDQEAKKSRKIAKGKKKGSSESTSA